MANPRLVRSLERKSLNRRGFAVLNLRDLVQSDDVRPDADLGIQAAELDDAASIPGLFHKVDEPPETRAAEILGVRQVAQELLPPLLSRHGRQLGSQFLALGGEPKLLAEDLDDGHVVDHFGLDVLEIDTGHGTDSKGREEPEAIHSILSRPTDQGVRNLTSR